VAMCRASECSVGGRSSRLSEQVLRLMGQVLVDPRERTRIRMPHQDGNGQAVQPRLQRTCCPSVAQAIQRETWDQLTGAAELSLLLRFDLQICLALLTLDSMRLTGRFQRRQDRPDFFV